MRSLAHGIAATAFFSSASAAIVRRSTPSLDSVCTKAYVAAHLPEDGFYEGLSFDSSAVTVNTVTNASVSGNVMYPDANFDYCNVTLTFSHDGRDDDTVKLTAWLPAPKDFQNRYLATGGGGYAIMGAQSLPGGVMYGAATTLTDGGFGADASNVLPRFLDANGTEDWTRIYAFGYKAIHDQILVGKAFTKLFYNMTAGDGKLYSYYQGCSEGGREGWSQVQRFTDLDGAIIGAPAFRFAFQQVQHLYAGVVEQTMGYYPPPCELLAIMNATIAACDALDGREDGVVSRNDLCNFHFDIDSTLGTSYSCAASAGIPTQAGKVSAKAIKVAKKILKGLHTSDGKRAYFTYTQSSTWTDARTTWNEATQSWTIAPTGLGGTFVETLLKLLKVPSYNMPSLDGVTYDTLRDWIWDGWNKYNDVLMTNWPDLSRYRDSGAKILHYHGESDFSIPTASSVRYWESVRSVLYPNLSYKEGAAAMDEFYRLFLVPGGSHCSTNAYEPNAPWPQTNLAVMIDWVEKGVDPKTLNATVLQGEDKGTNQQICGWPLRPLWTNGGKKMNCVYEQKSIDDWHYDLDAFPMPVY
ncbi:feruloyl esterase-like protein B precursor [Dactylonectria estremocensis]|uniref:Carboxylic ester hydrolase n=1 Tax=Dactylonectria estremocensis TaxID=1079267 RepID=A0A9P9E2U0_9HYPO|nr:feruloyl esterase-like protein B precursor [Dactylonectria estremocensis]